jgi:exonuclease III
VSLTLPAVISVCETWFTDVLTDSFVCPAGYVVFRKDRSSRGGVAIFVRKDIHTEPVSSDDCSHCDLEVIAIDLTFANQKIRLITCYRPPYYSAVDVTYLESLTAVLSKFCLAAQQNIVLGDFNLPNINWSHYLAPTEPCHDKFLSFVNKIQPMREMS